MCCTRRGSCEGVSWRMDLRDFVAVSEGCCLRRERCCRIFLSVLLRSSLRIYAQKGWIPQLYTPIRTLDCRSHLHSFPSLNVCITNSCYRILSFQSMPRTFISRPVLSVSTPGIAAPSEEYSSYSYPQYTPVASALRTAIGHRYKHPGIESYDPQY